jgi:hypothetical protein
VAAAVVAVAVAAADLEEEEHLRMDGIAQCAEEDISRVLDVAMCRTGSVMFISSRVRSRSG